MHEELNLKPAGSRFGVKAKLLFKFQALIEVADAVGSAGPTKTRRGHANSIMEGGFNRMSFVKPVQDAGGKGVARPNRAHNSRLRNAETPLDPHLPVAAKRASPFWKMYHHPFPHTRPDQLLGGMLQGSQIDAGFFAHQNAGGALEFKLV